MYYNRVDKKKKVGDFMEERQKWHCRTGCGEIFFTTKLFNKQRPFCPNCGTREAVEKVDHVFLTEIVKDRWGSYKSKIKNKNHD